MLRETAGNSPRFTRCPEPHGSLGPGFRARRYRFTARLSHIMRSTGCAAPERGSAERGPDPRCSRGAGSPALPAAARRAPPLPLVPSGKGKGAEQGWLLPRSARARPPLPLHNLPRWRGRRGSRCRGGRLPILMVLGNPASASPSSPASSSRRVRGALCPIFFSPCGSAPKPKLAAQAWAQLETRSGVSGGGDAGGGGGEDGPPPFVSFFFILSFPKSLCSRLHPSLAGLIGCEIAFLPRLQQPPPNAGTSPKDGG